MLNRLSGRSPHNAIGTLIKMLIKRVDGSRNYHKEFVEYKEDIDTITVSIVVHFTMYKSLYSLYHLNLTYLLRLKIRKLRRGNSEQQICVLKSEQTKQGGGKRKCMMMFLSLPVITSKSVQIIMTVVEILFSIIIKSSPRRSQRRGQGLSVDLTIGQLVTLL